MRLDKGTARPRRSAWWWVVFYASRAFQRVWYGKVDTCVVVTSESNAETGSEFATWLREGANAIGHFDEVELFTEQLDMPDDLLIVTQRFSGGLTSLSGRWISRDLTVDETGVY